MLLINDLRFMELPLHAWLLPHILGMHCGVGLSCSLSSASQGVDAYDEYANDFLNKDAGFQNETQLDTIKETSDRK